MSGRSPTDYMLVNNCSQAPCHGQLATGSVRYVIASVWQLMKQPTHLPQNGKVIEGVFVETSGQ
jgi:hypothetical protein